MLIVGDQPLKILLVEIVFFVLAEIVLAREASEKCGEKRIQRLIHLLD